MLCESGGSEETFLAKSNIPSLGILVCQGALSDNYVHRTQLGEGAAELSAAHGWCLGWGHHPMLVVVTGATCCSPPPVSLWVPCGLGVPGEFPSATSSSRLPMEPTAGCPAHQPSLSSR